MGYNSYNLLGFNKTGSGDNIMSDNPKMDDSVDTTDCLEAIGAFKSMKNLLFLVTLLALLIVQGVFWLNYTGCIDLSDSPYQQTMAVEPVTEPATEPAAAPAPVTTPATEVKSEESAQPEKPAAEIAEKPAEEQVPAEASTEKAPAEEVPVVEAPKKHFEKLTPKYAHAVAALRVSNFALVISATMYSLVLLMTLKISLAGRLGGINHISRAFFLSLFALVILLPWQKLFAGVCFGAIYTPAELFGGCTTDAETSLAGKVMYFLRFSGMWAVVVVLLLGAQIRTAKWSKTTLRRLGIVR